MAVSPEIDPSLVVLFPYANLKKDISMVLDSEDYAGISDFFAGFAVERRSNMTTGN